MRANIFRAPRLLIVGGGNVYPPIPTVLGSETRFHHAAAALYS